MMQLQSRTIAVLVLLAISFSAAEQESAKNEAGLLLGAIDTPPIGSSGFAGSIRVGTGISFQVTYALYLEFPAVAVPLQELSATNGAAPVIMTPSSLRLRCD
jgi:hypothetical protein